MLGVVGQNCDVSLLWRRWEMAEGNRLQKTSRSWHFEWGIR